MNEGEFATLVAASRVLEKDWRGARVLLTRDGRIVKLIRHKRLFTSNRIWPYAWRFRRNAAILRTRGFRTVQVEQVFRSPSLRADVVIYPFIRGETIRARLAAGGDVGALLAGLAGLVARLHDRGIHFRGLHLGNVVCDGDAPPALIDIQAMRFYRRPLTWRLRVRNLLKVLAEPKDRDRFGAYGYERFLAEYLAQWGIGRGERLEFLARLQSRAVGTAIALACDRLLAAVRPSGDGDEGNVSYGVR